MPSLISFKQTIRARLAKNARSLVLSNAHVSIISLYCYFNNLISSLKFYPVKLVPYYILRPDNQVICKAQSTFAFGHRTTCAPAPKVAVEIPPLGYSLLKNYIVHPYNNISVSADMKIAQYQQSWPKYRNGVVNLSGGNIMVHNNTTAIIKLTQANIIKIEKGIALLGHWPDNWYHWIIEILSKHAIINRLPEKYKTYPLLIPDFKEDSNHFKILKFLFPNFSIVRLTYLNSYLVSDLIYVDSTNYGPPSFRFYDAVEVIEDNMVIKKYLQEYKSKLEASIPSISKVTYPTKIFLARKQNARSYNQDEIEKLLQGLGFTSMYFENYSLIEQANILKSATFIIGPTGAAWANIIFCKPNTKAIIWTPDCTKQAAPYSSLSENLNLNIRYLYYKTNTKSWREFMHQKRGYYLSPTELEVQFNNLNNDTCN